MVISEVLESGDANEIKTWITAQEYVVSCLLAEKDDTEKSLVMIEDELSLESTYLKQAREHLEGIESGV